MATPIFRIAIAFCLATAALVAAEAASPATMPRTIYVQDFEAHTEIPPGTVRLGEVPSPSCATCARARRP